MLDWLLTWQFFIGFVIGGCVGVLLMCIVVVGARNDLTQNLKPEIFS